MTTPVVIESGFSWLDHREEDAQRAREVLKALDEGNTVDSIGIGTVRDAIADLLFPAISTLHTRARYFLFVPWIYQELEADRVPSSRAAKEGRDREIRLTYSLLAGCEEGTQGIIGQVAKDRLKQLPRIVYWNGTAALGIRRFPGSIRQYFQSLDGYYRRTRRELTKEDDADAFGPGSHNWDPSLPAPPDGWLSSTTLDLTADEADYLVDRAKVCLPGTLLAELIGRAAMVDADFPWEVDDQATLPIDVRDHLVHARWFSETIHGAQLLYNLMVAEAVKHDGGDGVHEEDFRARMEAWAEKVDANAAERAGWDRTEFWRVVLSINGRIPQAARSFIEGWFNSVDQGASTLITDPTWRERVTQREFRLKRGLARLTNARARETWGGATGAGQLTFRWPEASQAVNDIALGVSP